MNGLMNWRVIAALVLVSAGIMVAPSEGRAQQQAASTTTSDQQAPPGRKALSAMEMEVLVARIALYPDELVALITSASIHPLQIVEAGRYLDAYAKDKSLKPKDSWDGSVISLLNYPEIVTMMSHDLAWTQQLGDAIAWQQKDVLAAIQKLRSDAVAKGVIKSGDQIKVVKENNNIVIQSSNPEVVYVPRYDPRILYASGYPPAPVAYYPNPYPNYWYPTATFFAGAVTGAIWAAAVDWNNGGVWGGGWNGNDINIDCNNCFNNRNFNGKVNLNDVDWRNVDRSKIKIDNDQLAKFDSTNIRNRVEANDNNSLRNRTADIRNRDIAASRPNAAGKAKNIHKRTLEGLRPAAHRPSAGQRDAARAAARSSHKVDRSVGRPHRPAAKAERRPSRPSAHANRGHRSQVSKVNSHRGTHARHGGRGHRPVKHHRRRR